MGQITTTLVVLVFFCFLGAAEAQHAGGGHGGTGHGAGGHSGRGHGSIGHSSATGHVGSLRTGGRSKGAHPFHWLHLGSGHGAAKPALLGGTIKPGNLPMSVPTRPVSSTLLLDGFQAGAALGSRVWGSTVSRHPIFRNGLLATPAFANRPRFFVRRHPCFRSSGCFFNGFTQVCFFEPGFSLLVFSGGFGYSSSIADDSIESPGDPSVVPVEPATDTSMNEATQPSHSQQDSLSREPGADAQEVQGSERLFVLVLKNGAKHRVMDYWVQDGYLEYVSNDGSRSHIPIEALDLEKTALENSRRGLVFVVRSAPSNMR
ncbi:MAG: hypothetical protein JO356_12180 [Acidobacteria bacterium]|nr:hypothetical protein [Acidobacteriota bacterium]